MTAQELAYHIAQVQRAIKNGELSNTDALRQIAWLSLVAQGVPRSSASQLHTRMAEVADAARFAGENPTPEEIDASCAFISRMGD